MPRESQRSDRRERQEARWLWSSELLTSVLALGASVFLSFKWECEHVPCRVMLRIERDKVYKELGILQKLSERFVSI